MTNIKTFYRKEDIQLQACEWISRIDRQLSPDEQQALQHWANTSELHQKTLFAMAQTWDDLSVLNELNGLMPLDRIDGQNRHTQTHKILWPMVASIGFLVISMFSWLMLNQDTTEHTGPLTSVFSTAVGEQKPLTLDDGSVLYLNTNTTVKVDFSASRRHIQLLKGEAHFDVAHDENRPFVVAAASNTVTAVGTAFNVQLLNDAAFELLVTEGKVLVKNSQQSTEPSPTGKQALLGEGSLLHAGQKALVASNSTETQDLSIEQMQNDLAWRQGIVVFNGEPLGQALSEISRYMPVQFELSDEQIKQQRMAGFFKAGDLDGLLAALKNNFNIQHQKMDNQKILLFSTP